MMDLFSRGELGLLGGGEGLRDDVVAHGIRWSPSHLPEDMYPASGLALAAAYHDIKVRLASLERENSSIKRKLEHYEVKFPMITEFGEETILCCSCEPIIKDTSTIQSQTTNLQQRINSLTQELQKSKEREERLEEVIQAYEKIHLEKSNVQRDLDKMTTLVEQHVDRIRILESALRQRDSSLQKLSTELHSKDLHKSQLHASLDILRDGSGPTLQSSCSLDALLDLKVQQLEAELEGAQNQAEGAFQREKAMRAEVQRLQHEVAKLREAQRQDLSSHCEHCDVEWIKKAGDEQVNLALAYTELTEELGHVRCLAAKQSDLLQHVSQEPVVLRSVISFLYSSFSRSCTAPQHLSPTSSQRASLSPDRLLPTPPSPMSSTEGPTCYSHQPTSSRLRAKFQGRRSYSEVRLHILVEHENDNYIVKYFYVFYFVLIFASLKSKMTTILPNYSIYFNPTFLLIKVHHFCHTDEPTEPTPLVTPPQSSDDEEVMIMILMFTDFPLELEFILKMCGVVFYVNLQDVCTYPSPAASLPHTLGAVGTGSSSPREQPLHSSFQSPRKQPHHPSFSALEGPTMLSCHLPPYVNTEHAQSWPSINLWMESEENAARSCPLCQLTFPTSYPDDALIKHIDSHLENSKI
ncbi:hypothetical protein ACER0C_014911 [Sarotherodon galilaeus]